MKRFKQLFKREKYQFVDLTASLKKVMFTGGHPVIVSEDSVTFALVMSVFNQYEKYVSALYDTSSKLWDSLALISLILLCSGKA